MSRLILLAVVSLSCMLSAETLRLPCRYTLTTYTVHTLTGLTSDEKSRDTVMPRPLDVTKRTDMTEGVQVELRARNAGGNDKSDDDVAVLSAADAKKVADALDTFTTLQRAAQNKRENAKTELVNVPDSWTLSLVVKNAGRSVVMELSFGGATFVLEKNHADKLAAAIRKSL